MPSDNDTNERVKRPPRRRARQSRLPPDFMKFPYPTEAETRRIWDYLETTGVKEESKRCVANLLQYRAVRTRARLPRGPSAAVLVPLFVGRSGELYVLLSRRSDALKAFAGDTALPGGKLDTQDRTVEDTARREAFEEIGLPRDKTQVPLLCVMEPHLAKNEILVTPVVVLILDQSLQPNLNSFEVTSIFAQPLMSFLSSTPCLPNSRTADPNGSYHTFTDIPWSDGGAVRLHRFLTGRESEGVKPVFGLTAAILIKTATIGYGRTPDFELQPPNAPTPAQQIAYALLTPANPLRIACEREGIDTNKAAARLLRPPVVGNTPRTIEWAEIGREWKKLLEGNPTDTTRSNARRPAVDNGEGMSANVKVEARARDNRKGRKEHVDAMPALAKLAAFLDETRDMVNERMKEIQGDEKKLAKARKAFPRIVEEVKGRIDRAIGEDGEFDPNALFELTPEGKEVLEDGMTPGKGIMGTEDEVDDSEKEDQGIKGVNGEGKRRDTEMKEHNGKGGDARHTRHKSRKRDAKL